MHTAQHAPYGPETDLAHPHAHPPETALLPLTELDDEIERLGVPVP